MDIKTNGEYISLQRQLFGCYNQEGMCLLRGTE
jgi:hypothetical protein